MAEGLPKVRRTGAEGFAAEIFKLQRQIDSLRSALGAGLVIDGATGDLIIPGSRNIRLGSDVDGTGALFTSSFDGEDFAHPGTTGNYFGDDGAVLNELYLRPGSVGNDALSNPVLVQQGFQGTSGFGLSVAGAYVLAITKNTPAGFNSVVVTAFGRVVGQNSTGSSDSLYTTLHVNGAGGNQFPTGVGAGNGNTSSVGFTTTLTGLVTGQPVTTGLFASTGLAGWAASGANAADLSVTYSWSR